MPVPPFSIFFMTMDNIFLLDYYLLTNNIGCLDNNEYAPCRSESYISKSDICVINPSGCVCVYIRGSNVVRQANLEPLAILTISFSYRDTREPGAVIRTSLNIYPSIVVKNDLGKILFGICDAKRYVFGC